MFFTPQTKSINAADEIAEGLKLKSDGKLSILDCLILRSQTELIRQKQSIIQSSNFRPRILNRWLTEVLIICNQ
jgi:hypothetical protein